MRESSVSSGLREWRRGCHGDGVSEGKARSGHALDLSFEVSDGTVSATQSGFMDCITAAFTDEDQPMRETTVLRRYLLPALSSTRLKRDEDNSMRESSVSSGLREWRRGCHGDGVSEGKARSGHALDLSFEVSDGTVSATQSGFIDCITAAFTDQ